MFNKKNKNQPTALDNRISEKFEELKEAKTRLMSAVDRVIIANGVIDIYPEGADKARAIKDAEARKHSLLCTIGEYDTRLQEYNDLLNSKSERRTTLGYPIHYSTSHEIIEITYRNFWKK